MAISDVKKLDIIWKKIFGVAETDALNKDVLNETIATNILTFGHEVWAESGSIPTVPPMVTTPQVELYLDTTMARFSEDTTVVGQRTWLATDIVGTRLRDWIPPAIGPDYAIRVYVENLINNTTKKEINPTITNFEWVFDYNAGVLYFPNCIPAEVITTGASLYIEGYRYVGTKGVGDSATPPLPTPTGELEYEIAGSVFGKPQPNEVVMRFVVATPIRFVQELVNSQGYCTVLPAMDTEFYISKNGGVFGRMQFKAGSDGYAIFKGLETMLFPKDILLVVAPHDVDTTIEDIEWTLVAQAAG